MRHKHSQLFGVGQAEVGGEPVMNGAASARLR
jgi:hypothetical protein